jgi:hypothetical protein
LRRSDSPCRSWDTATQRVDKTFVGPSEIAAKPNRLPTSDVTGRNSAAGRKRMWQICSDEYRKQLKTFDPNMARGLEGEKIVKVPKKIMRGWQRP